MSSSRRYAAAAWLLAFAFIGGCENIEKPLIVPHHPTGLKPKTPPDIETLPPPVIAVEGLRQVENGPGIVVCEPVCDGSAKRFSQITEGIGGVLHLLVAGQGEFDKSPSWRSLSAAQNRLHRSDLQFGPGNVGVLKKVLGVTHAAVGTFSGDEKACSLTYQILDLEKNQKVGAPVQRTGSLDNVIGEIPGIATDLCARMGVKKPILPPDSGYVSAGIREVASMPEEKLYANGAKELARVGMGSLLGEAMYMSHMARQPGDDYYLHSGGFWERVPKNTVALAIIADAASSGQVYRGVGEPNFPGLSDLLKQHPNNLLLRNAQSYFYFAQARYNAAVEEGTLEVSANVRSPQAWSDLADLIEGSAQRMRRGRTMDAMTESEVSTLGQPYREALAVRQKIVELDPGSADAWVRVSSAAAFAGEMKTADAALWTALGMEKGNYRAYWWGMELYDPKWMGDAKKLKKVSEMAAADHFKYASERMDLAQRLYRQGVKDAPRRMLRDPKEYAEFRKSIAQANVPRVQPAIAQSNAPTKSGTSAKRTAGAAPAKLNQAYCHSGLATAVAWSPSGLWLASGGTDTVVKVWSVVQKTPRQLLGHTDTVNAVAWSPNEKRIATASKDGTLRIWTVADGQTERVMKCGSTPLCVAWSPDGRYVACGSHPGGVQLWDADSGSRVREAGSSGATIVAVQWTSDSRHLIAVSGWAAGKPDAVHQYGVPELKDERVIGQLVDTIGAAALSPDGVNLAVGTRTHGIRILRVADGATVASLEEPRISARVVAWGPNGNELAVAGTDFSIRVWDLHSGRISRNLKGHADRVEGIAWNKASGRLASCADDSTVMLWDVPPATAGPIASVETAKPLSSRELTAKHSEFWHCSFLGDGDRIAVGDQSGAVRVEDCATGRALLEQSPPKKFRQVVGVTPDCGIVIRKEGAKLSICETRPGGEVAILTDETRDIANAISSDGKLLAEIGIFSVAVVNLKDKKPVLRAKSEGNSVCGVFVPTLNELAVGSGDFGKWGQVTFYDLASGRIARRIRMLDDIASILAVSRDGKRLAVVDRAGRIGLWNPRTGEKSKSFQAVAPATGRIAFTPDGKYLLSAGADGKVRYWNLSNGKLERSLSFEDNAIVMGIASNCKWIVGRLQGVPGPNRPGPRIWSIP